MQKKIEKIIDWKNSIVFVLFTDGTKSYAHSAQTTYKQQQDYLREKAEEDSSGGST